MELARRKPRFGYRRLHILLDQSGERVNHKRIFRVYREAGLAVRRKSAKKAGAGGFATAGADGGEPGMGHGLRPRRHGRRTSHPGARVVDEYTRECLALEVDTSFASRRVTRVLEQIVAERGKPLAIRSDNGPEFTSRHILAWCLERGIDLMHIQPGKPQQNGYVESFPASCGMNA